jgi:hypothetical protein
LRGKRWRRQEPPAVRNWHRKSKAHDFTRAFSPALRSSWRGGETLRITET